LVCWSAHRSGIHGRGNLQQRKTVERVVRRNNFIKFNPFKRRLEMAETRKVEIFSAGCPACDETVKLVESIACPSCDVAVLDMHDPNVAIRAKSLGVQSVPAVVIGGKLADCCSGRGPDEATLKSAGLGQPMS
jgi:glutaredoxin